MMQTRVLLFLILLGVAAQPADAQVPADTIVVQPLVGANVVPLPEVVKKGDGEDTLLLIGCFSCRWNQWEEFMERNQDAYTMYAVTLPGFGGTPTPDLPMNTGEPVWRNNALAALSALLDQEGLEDVTVMGHSFGSMVGLQLAARRADVITRYISVDGTVESTSWTPEAREEQLAQSQQVHDQVPQTFDDAEEWRVFNGTTSLPRDSMVTRERALQAIRVVGGFMATPREVVVQYWSENPLVDLTEDLHRLAIPVLDIRALRGADQEGMRQQYLSDLVDADAVSIVRPVFLYDSSHYFMFNQPEVLDQLVADFIAGRELPVELRRNPMVENRQPDEESEASP